MRRELGHEPLAIVRFDAKVVHSASAQFVQGLVAEHRDERGIRGNQLAVERALIDAVDDVVEQRAKTRLADAQRRLVLLAAYRDAGELGQTRGEIELLCLRPARRLEVDRERAVDSIAGRDDRRRAAAADAALSGCVA